MNILFIDTETTGTDPKKHGIIEIAAEFHVNGKKVSEFNTKFFGRNHQVSMGALKVNKGSIQGLLKLEAEEKGVVEFVDWLLALDSREPITICGHNVHFDISFIKALLDKYAIEEWDQAVSYRHLDTCSIGRFLIESGVLRTPIGKSGANLSNVATCLGINLAGRSLHTAKDDVALTAEVYYKMLELVRGDKRL